MRAMVAVFGRYGKVIEVKMKDNYCFVEVCGASRARLPAHAAPNSWARDLRVCLSVPASWCVQFENVSDAELAISKLDGYVSSSSLAHRPANSACQRASIALDRSR